jgi:hypothetical protein
MTDISYSRCASCAKLCRCAKLPASHPYFIAFGDPVNPAHGTRCLLITAVRSFAPILYRLWRSFISSAYHAIHTDSFPNALARAFRNSLPERPVSFVVQPVPKNFRTKKTGHLPGFFQRISVWSCMKRVLVCGVNNYCAIHW